MHNTKTAIAVLKVTCLHKALFSSPTDNLILQQGMPHLPVLRMSSVSFSNISETIGPIKAKIHVKLPWLLWGGGELTLLGNLGHMTKIAAMPYMVKTLQNHLQNQRANLKVDRYFHLDE